MSEPISPPFDSLLVACLCAQWCGTCTAYAPVFSELQSAFPGARFSWIDIEDEADLVEPIDVENFPTVLIATQGQARFFGTLTPHIDTLKRLLQAHAEDTGASRLPAPVQSLTARVLQRATR